jgi:predicted GNAT superfamily acetyltransferase
VDGTIRDLRPDDLPAVHALNTANVPAVGEATFDHLARLVEMAHHALVADVAGRVAGFCVVLAPGADYGSVNYRWFSERYDDFVYLDRVAVDHAMRGRRIGTALYAEVERRCADRAWFTLEVNLRPRNDASLAFHERLGFVEVGQQETPYGCLVSLQAKPL